MKYEIEEATIGQAEQCRHDYACLSGDECPTCKAQDLARGEGGEVLFIECPKDSDCVFCQSFGDTHICQCPVRLELFKRYGR